MQISACAMRECRNTFIYGIKSLDSMKKPPEVQQTLPSTLVDSGHRRVPHFTLYQNKAFPNLDKNIRWAGGTRYQDWRGCAAPTTWPWHWENIKYDQKTLRLYTLREHIAYYEVEKHTWENTDNKNWQKVIPWENTCPQKVYPDGWHISVPPTYGSMA